MSGRFVDAAIERRFVTGERLARVVHMRLFAAFLATMLIGYALVNPLYFSRDDELRFTLLLIPALAILAGYAAATAWRGYASRPMIDFACLLGVAFLIMAENALLFEEMQRAQVQLHASIAINGLIVMAFAAIAFAGQVRWFAAWLACHAAVYFGIMVVTEADIVPLIYATLAYVTSAAVMVLLNWSVGQAHRQSFILSDALEAERAKTEELLFNVLPPAVAARLKAGQVVADSYPDVSVVFIDICGFSDLSRRISPGHLVDLLNGFFLLADKCAADTGVEKVKTIGDAYLAISGGNNPAVNSADAAIRFGEAVIAGLPDLRTSTGIDLHIRVGIHTGPVVGGVIGETRMAYDYWGETMNIASRIEGAAKPDGIAVSETTWMRGRGDRHFELPQVLTLKGVGDMPVYRLADKPTAEIIRLVS
ncbi:adenylate/guanylate cyclase domain-containing protein [Blastomonas sp.]|uniref:adenylate/guanylate cyclase domain-containing protein n=1 Tax=Blastomonas sp. TaxID=1909299 RepID=UPI002612C76A|nr:adenylate/guanylate cyclase domain-containing protein [Blastomonas sp.]MDM7956385.1 adenylate/guanylate cyclase domain-containing protein [Blastomonas sp.]